jgi:hypothetical protein
MPNNRAGRIVRCPKCKSPIRLPSVAKNELASGQPVHCQARIVRPRNSEQDEIATAAALNSSCDEQEPSGQDQLISTDPKSAGVTPRLPVPEVLKPVERKKFAPQWTPRSAEEDSDQEPLAATADAPPSAASPTAESSSGAKVDRVNQDLDAAANSATPQAHQADPMLGPILDHESDIESPEDWIDGEGIQIVIRDLPAPKSLRSIKSKTDAAGESASISEVGSKEVKPTRDQPAAKARIPKQRAIDRVSLPKPKPKIASLGEEPVMAGLTSGSQVPVSSSPLLINLQPAAGKFDGPLTAQDWQARLEKSNSDRKIMARFFALCLCVVAIVNMVPAFYHWYSWTLLTDSLPLPRWIYILIFVGAVHLIYAIFLAQVPDWSAMRAVALAMLAVAFVFGFVSTGLLVGGGQGNLTGFLGIPFALNRQACIWCVAMLCLATLMSYWGGKESSNWQRAEHLLSEILSTPAVQT